MQLYDTFIQEFYRLLTPYREYRVTENVARDCFAWDSRRGQFLLKSEAAVELGGGGLPAVSGTLYTCEEWQALCVQAGSETGKETAEDCRPVTLYGPDLPALKGEAPYARVTLVKVRKEFAAEEYKLYNMFRSIEYIRYHVDPRGYMPRVSTAQSREQVRVSRDAVERGLDFYKAGRVYEDAYLSHPAVEGAETFFITLADFDYSALQKLLDRAEDVTMSLEHSLGNLRMDCTVCGLKPVCDQAEACLGQ